MEYKELTPEPLRDYIYELKEARYGDRLGPTYDYFKTELKKTDAQIIASASRTNSDIDKFLSGFEEWAPKQW